MREIEFRAWDKRGKTMHEVKALSFDYCDMSGMKGEEIGVIYGKPYVDELSIENAKKRGIAVANHSKIADTCILMQYTGLNDGKKTKEYPDGQKIYEGDIVECRMSFEGGTLPHMGEIVYDNEFGAFGTRNDSGITLLHNHCLHTLEVIGNIHQNPELMPRMASNEVSRKN